MLRAAGIDFEVQSANVDETIAGGESPNDYVSRLAEAKDDLFKLRFQHATGQLENTARLKQAKTDLARGLTIAGQRDLDVEAEIRKLG